MAEVLSNLGVKRGMVVYGQDCLDEISLSAPTSVCEIKDGTFEEYVITPEEFGMSPLHQRRAGRRNSAGEC